MSNGKGSGRRPAAITRAEFDAAWERNFGAKQPPREMADPTTCEHRNKVYTNAAEYPRCHDCGVTLKPVPCPRWAACGYNDCTCHPREASAV